MTATIVGSRYARALVELVTAPGSNVKAGEAIAQIKAVEEMIVGSHDLHSVLMTPAVQMSKKKAIIGKLAEIAGISQLIRNFLLVVLGHKRIAKLTEIREAFEVLMDEHLGFVRAEVTSAAPLEAAQIKMIEAELMRMSGKQVRMETAVDADLLGGVIARIGSTVYDGSIRGQLESMRRKLTSETSAHKAEL